MGILVQYNPIREEMSVNFEELPKTVSLSDSDKDGILKDLKNKYESEINFINSKLLFDMNKFVVERIRSIIPSK